MMCHGQPGFVPQEPIETNGPYGDWQPERAAYVRYGMQILTEIAALESHVGGPLTAQRLSMLAAMKKVEPPEGSYTFEAAAIRKLKTNPSRGCPPYIRDGLTIQLQRIWPVNLARPARSEVLPSIQNSPERGGASVMGGECAALPATNRRRHPKRT